MAFLFLLSSTLVMVLVLLATRHYYPTFDAVGRTLAWAVVAGSLGALASVASLLMRLYVHPMVGNGRAHRKRNA